MLKTRKSHKQDRFFASFVDYHNINGCGLPGPSGIICIASRPIKDHQVELVVTVVALVGAVVATEWIATRTLDEKINGIRDAWDGRAKALESATQSARQVADEQMASIKDVIQSNRRATNEQVASIRTVIENDAKEHDDFRRAIQDTNARLDLLMATLIEPRRRATGHFVLH